MDTHDDEAKTEPHLGSGPSFRTMLPGSVSVAELREDGDAVPPLLPRESEHAAAFAPVRRREFAMGRHCARAALERLGFLDTEILVGPKREPVWPDPICGSISHASGAWAAAVAWRSDVHALGLDIDTDEPLPDGTAEEIVRADERSLPIPHGLSVELWEKIVFSAKESVFKAWFPTTRRWLDFLDCRIRVERDGVLIAEVSTARPSTWPKRVVGAWSVSPGRVRTAAWIEAAQQTRSIVINT